MIRASVLKANLEKGMYKDLLLDIYEDESLLEYQIKRYIKAVEKYEELYGDGEVMVCSAPGRSEVCGNHTDHQHGQILAAAINLDAIAICSPTDDKIIKFVSDNLPELVIDTASLELKEEEKETTKSLVKGVLKASLNDGFEIGGFRAYITSDVLIGAGLSSSAAFEALIGTIISHLYNNGTIDPITVAINGQYAENVYFGKPCGLMDQMACSVGSLVHVDFANPKEPKVNRVEWDMNKQGYSLCITDTKGSHVDLTSEYAAMPIEMKKVAAYFGQEVCLSLTIEDILENITPLRESCGDRAVLRAIHFINENKRVPKEVEALKNDDMELFLKTVRESGNSSYKFLQNTYVSFDIEHQNIPIALAISEYVLGEDGGAARVHGGGLAGTIQAFVKNDKVEAYVKALDKVFGAGSCKVLKIRKYGGMKVVD